MDSDPTSFRGKHRIPTCLFLLEVQAVPVVGQGGTLALPVLQESDSPKRHEDAEEDSPWVVEEVAHLCPPRKRKRRPWEKPTSHNTGQPHCPDMAAGKERGSHSCICSQLHHHVPWTTTSTWRKPPQIILGTLLHPPRRTPVPVPPTRCLPAHLCHGADFGDVPVVTSVAKRAHQELATTGTDLLPREEQRTCSAKGAQG